MPTISFQTIIRSTPYVLGSALLYWAVITMTPSIEPWPIFAGLVAVATTLAILGRHINIDAGRRWSPGGTINLTAVAHVFAVVGLGPLVAISGSFLSSLVFDSARRRPLRDRFDNAFVDALSTLAAAIVVFATGLDRDISLPFDYLPLVVAVLAYSLAFQCAYSMVTLARSTKLRPAVNDMLECFIGDTRSTLGESLIGLALAIVFRTNPWVLPAVLPAGFALWMAMSRSAKLQTLTNQALETFAGIVDERDRYTFEHSTRVCEFSTLIGRELDLPENELHRLYWTSRLHDLGKVAIDDTILNKPGKLTEAEFNVIKEHPIVSARILSSFTFDEYSADIVRCHHERYDGGGYLRRHHVDVPFEAFIIAVADSFDAMTSDRTYRGAMSIEAALQEILDNIGTQFHPRAAKAFLTAMARDGYAPADTSQHDLRDAA